MPRFRITGRDAHRGLERVFYAEAPTPEAACANLARRGILEPRAELIDSAAQPADAITFFVASEAEPGPSSDEGVSVAGLAVRRLVIFLGALAFLAAMYVFVDRAKQHLGRARPPAQEQATPSGNAPSAQPPAGATPINRE
jgi:hypothetical protein